MGGLCWGVTATATQLTILVDTHGTCAYRFLYPTVHRDPCGTTLLPRGSPTVRHPTIRPAPLPHPANHPLRQLPPHGHTTRHHPNPSVCRTSSSGPPASSARSLGSPRLRRSHGGARSLTTAIALPYAAGKMLWPAWGPLASAHAFRSRAAAVVSHPQPPAPTAAFVAIPDATSRDGTKHPAGRSNSWPVATASPASLEMLPSCPLFPCSRHPRLRHLGMVSLPSLPSGARLR